MRALLPTLLLSSLSLATGSSLHAQELLACNYGGQALSIDTATGVARVLGASDVPFGNALTVKGSTYFATGKAGGVTRLYVVNPLTGRASSSKSLGAIDVRALADSPLNDELFAIVNGTNDVDRLVRVRVSTGQVTPVGTGTTGQTGIQAIVRSGSKLFGWDVQLGLVRLNTTNGSAAVAFPGVGTSGAHIQFLTFDDQGRLLGGQDQLFEVNLHTGTATLVPGSACLDARGAALRRGVVVTFDSPCGDDAVMTATTLANPGALIEIVTSGHTPNAFVILFLAAQKQQTVLPGTNCKLGISDDDPLGGMVANAAGVVEIATALPNIPGFTWFGQFLGEQPGSGALYVTNGIEVRLTN